MTDSPLLQACSAPLEEWRAVVGYESFYEVSNTGRVRSLDRAAVISCCGGTRRHAGRILSSGKQKSGHLFVHLSVNNKVKGHRVHRLVAAAFIGPCPSGLQVNHIDGDPANNNVANLEYVTHQANTRHAAKLGRMPSGEKHSAAKLSCSKVIAMRVMRQRGYTYESIGAMHGVSRRTAARACTGESWKGVQS